jgi:hypothetical protein
MDLPLNQLVYTSFSYVGFGLLTSEQVPLHIEQTFLKQVVYRHWNAFEHENHSYRAAYLVQITPEDWLFGWLYNDERDDIDRSHIPHFICYHLREALYAFCIEKICACLQKGPVELVDHHNFSNSLEPLILKDVSSYQEARPGVLISWEVRQQIHMNLKQGKLTDLFIPAKEHQRLIERSLPVESQQVVAKDKSADNASLLPLIPLKEHQTLIERSPEVQPQQVVAKDKSIDNDSLLPLIPLKEHQRLIERSLLVEPQEILAKDKSADNASLLPLIPLKEHQRLIERSLPVEPQEILAKDKSPDNDSLLPLIPLKEHQRLIERSLPVEPQQVVAKDKSPDNGSLVLNRNFILLLGISFGIITSLVVTALIYIFFITSVRNQPTQSPSQNALPRTAAPTTKISPKP